MTDFAKWLKKKKLTVETFARKAGVQVGTVSKWRSGAKPRPVFREMLGPLYPDCELFK